MSFQTRLTKSTTLKIALASAASVICLAGATATNAQSYINGSFTTGAPSVGPLTAAGPMSTPALVNPQPAGTGCAASSSPPGPAGTVNQCTVATFTTQLQSQSTTASGTYNSAGTFFGGQAINGTINYSGAATQTFNNTATTTTTTYFNGANAAIGSSSSTANNPVATGPAAISSTAANGGWSTGVNGMISANIVTAAPNSNGSANYTETEGYATTGSAYYGTFTGTAVYNGSNQVTINPATGYNTYFVTNTGSQFSQLSGGVNNWNSATSLQDRVWDSNGNGTTITATGVTATGVVSAGGFNANGNKVTNVANGTVASDAANFGQLTAETTRATTAEATLQTNINNETTRATAAEATLQSNINAETTRATAAETTLNTKITNETTRATAAEATLNTKITNETTRATAAETTLQTNITTETNRATAAEATLQTNLTAEANRAIAAETTLQTNITTETNRAKAAETTLQTNINTVATNLAAETTRATAAEATLQSNINAETTRAKAAEAALAATMAANYVDLRNQIRNGVAVATSLSGATLIPGKKFSFTVNYGGYQGKSAISGQAAWLVSPNVALNAGVGGAVSGGSGSGAAVRAGATIGF